MRHCWGTMTMPHTRSGHDRDRSRNMRTRNRRLGPLVQDPPPPLPGRHHTTTSRQSTHNNTKGSGLNKPPQNPGLDTPAKGHCTRYAALHPLRSAAPVTSRCTRYVALHPLRRAAPVTWRCTRYVALHPNRRGVMPTDRVQCLQIGCTTPATSSHADLPERTSTDPTGLAGPGGAVQTAGWAWRRSPNSWLGPAAAGPDRPSRRRAERAARGADNERATERAARVARAA